MNDVKDVENNVGELTAIVAYYTRYTSVNKLPIFLSLGLGNEVAVNAIIEANVKGMERMCGF